MKTRAGGGPTAGSSASNCVRIASYNIHLGIGRDGAFEPARIAAVIAETGADVVALQEISLGAPGFDMLHYLCEATGMAGVAGPTLVTARGEYGNAVLSRHPVTAAVRLDMSVPGREPRGALDVRADCNGRPLRIIATHFGLRPAERRAQALMMLAHVQKSAGEDAAPLVLTGDVNEWFLWGRPLRWLHRHFGHSPMPPSFPSGHPLLALDRIWAKPAQALHAVRAHKSALARMASDHLPVTAFVSLNAAQQLTL
ncbi:MAG TPA: endonuclease/exonuclease/phosphatase family protein [Burkholderiales bacterium]|nr:endonuclease/exonuclease/phosphatase family protein [Burkholderiales bacterium]